jgi:hypothetical protein
VHVLDAAARSVTLPPLGSRVTSATLLGTGERVNVAETATGVAITLPAAAATVVDRVVVIAIAR